VTEREAAAHAKLVRETWLWVEWKRNYYETGLGLEWLEPEDVRVGDDADLGGEA